MRSFSSARHLLEFLSLPANVYEEIGCWPVLLSISPPVRIAIVFFKDISVVLTHAALSALVPVPICSAATVVSGSKLQVSLRRYSR